MKRPLSKKEWDQLLMAPVYVTLLGCHHDGKLDKKEKKGAVNLSHLRTFTAAKDLLQYYRDVELNFEENLDRLDAELPDVYQERKVILYDKLEELLHISRKLYPNYRNKLIESLKSFSKHMAHVNDSFLQELSIPILMDYLNENKDEDVIHFDED